MKKFVLTDSFKALNVGFALDEGMANPGEEFIVFNGERSIWRNDKALFYYYFLSRNVLFVSPVAVRT